MTSLALIARQLRPCPPITAVEASSAVKEEGEKNPAQQREASGLDCQGELNLPDVIPLPHAS